ncbi:MAG: penicillin-binding protein activator [Pseudomonadota bacterium]
MRATTTKLLTGPHRADPHDLADPHAGTRSKRIFAQPLGKLRSMAAAGVLAGVTSLLALGGCSTSPGGSFSNGALSQPAGSPTDITKSTTAQPAGLSSGNRQSVKLALLLPTSASGQTAEIAKGLKQAAEMALFDRNAPNIKLLVKDTAGTPDGARKAAEAAVAAGADIIIGPLFARSVKTVKPVAAAAGLPVLAFSNDASVAGNGVYLLSFQAHQDVTRIIQYAASQGRRRFAALIPEDARGNQLAALFKASVQQVGGSVVAIETYPPGANGMLENSQRLFESAVEADTIGEPIDAIFIPGGPETLPTLGPIIKYTKVDTTRIKLLGTGSWDFPTLSRQSSFVGGWFPAPDPRGWNSFSAKYSQTYGAAAPRIASLAYDAVSIAVTLSNSVGSGRKFTADRLTQAAGFAGTDGVLRLRPNGLLDRGLAIIEVDANGSRVIEPAPRTFNGPQG